MKLLLEKGAEPDPKDEHGRTPLWWAAEKGHEVMVKRYLTLYESVVAVEPAPVTEIDTISLSAEPGAVA